MKTVIITVTAITAEEKKRQYARGAILKMVGDKRVCVVCGAEYISHHPKQLCCCKACSKANYKNAPSHTREAKNEVAAMGNKLSELSEDELKNVFCGSEDNFRLEETDDQNDTGHGLEDREHIFEPGSRFWLKWLDR